MSNSTSEQIAIDMVMRLERAAGRTPTDTRFGGQRPYDIHSPPRKIEVKAYGKSARGQVLPLEDRQVQAAKSDPENFFVYVVDHINDGSEAMTVRALHGAELAAMIDRTKPMITYWPTLRAAEYDNAVLLERTTSSTDQTGQSAPTTK